MSRALQEFLLQEEGLKNFASSTPHLQLNIMEAVKLDLLKKRVDKARVGLVLAAIERTGDFLLAETNEMLIRLSKKWIDGYIT